MSASTPTIRMSTEMASVVRFCPIAPMMARIYIVPGAMTETSMLAKLDALA